MALEAIFTVTIVLALTWILLSVFTNSINDWINVRISKHAKDLEAAIYNMLQEDIELLRKFYQHRKIRSLTHRRKNRTARYPAWFYKYPVVRELTREVHPIPNNIPSSIFADSMFDVLVYECLTPEEAKQELSTARIQTSIERLKLEKPDLSQILSDLFPRLDRPAILEAKIAECKSNIENWYITSTDALVENQQRYEQTLALLVGFLIALLLNIDMLGMATYLWKEPTIREALVQSAQQFQLPSEQVPTNPEETVQGFMNLFEAINFPAGWRVSNLADKSSLSHDCQLFPSTTELFGIPIMGTNRCIAPTYFAGQSNLASKLAGIFVTALAARMGAPFLSDVFKRLVGPVRKGEHS